MPIHYVCDACGIRLAEKDQNRFIIKIEAYAAAGVLEISDQDLQRDTAAELARTMDELRRADPSDMEDQTYRSFTFDLCPKCHKAFLKRPLGGLDDSAKSDR
jgi:hypothetical protein